MKIKVELSRAQLEQLIIAHIKNKLGDDIKLKPMDLTIEVKSTQNYKSEWENAEFRARYEGDI